MAYYKDTPSYWSGLSPTVFSDLEKYIDAQFDLEKQTALPGEVLLGMASTIACRQEPGFHEKYVQYVRYAAHASSVSAQGIIGRLFEAIGLLDTESRQVRVGWLQEAVSTGSLIAGEDLNRIDPTLYDSSKRAFREMGGYNDEARGIRMISTSWPRGMSQMTLESTTVLCDTLGTPDMELDARGNTLLHFAAMYGKVDIISFLIKEKRASINAQNFAGETPLYKACLSASTAAVRSLITLGGDAKIVSKPFGISCVHWLFNFEASDMKQVAELLVYQGKAEVNAQTLPGEVDGRPPHIQTEHFPFHWPFGTALHWAVAARSMAAVGTLLDSGAEINALDHPDCKNPQTALMLAMYRADAELAEYLVSLGADSGSTISYGRNVIHMLVGSYLDLTGAFRLPRAVWSWVMHGSAQNNTRQVQRCLFLAKEAGVQLDTPGLSSHTPLMDAIEHKDACGALVLLEAGANADILYPAGQVTLQEWLLKDSRCMAYPQLYFPVLEQLLQKITDINRKNESYGESAVHWVARSVSSNDQFEKTLALLLAQNPPANVNARDRYGQTPFLDVATHRKAEEVMSRTNMLIRLNADPKLRDNDGRDFLYALCENESLTDQETLGITMSVMNQFPEQDRHCIASVSRLQSEGSTALISAVREGKLSCARYLVGLNIDINAVDTKARKTALDCAIDAADLWRDVLICNAIDTFGIGHHVDALEDGTAFTMNFYTGKPDSTTR